MKARREKVIKGTDDLSKRVKAGNVDKGIWFEVLRFMDL